ncbi:MAG: CDP-glucose 4,6-dehydratase [Bacteriovoracaceae bacterium]|nr:CDP-glucose 4,6-dehydratase [Bacteriovoracaceae bacterium]
MFNGIYKGKRVLVTGHTGFKGAWLFLWLKKLGAEVKGYSVDIPTSPSLFEESGLNNEVGLKSLDIRSYSNFLEVMNTFKPEIVFHLAAQSIVKTCYEDPRLAFETNLMGTVNVLKALEETPSVRSAVFITSDKCYENVEWEYGYRENDRLGGKDPYSASKASAEIAFSAFSRSFFVNDSGTRIASARAGNVIGGGDWARARIVPDCVRTWSNGQAVEIRNPNATRPWQLVLEPLSGYLQLGAQLFEGRAGLSGESFNFGPKEDTCLTVVELIEEMKQTWGGGEYFVNSPKNSQSEAGLLRLCCDKALSKMNWRAVLDAKETISMTTEWYKNFYSSSGNRTKEYTLSQIESYENLAHERGHSWALR